jgi:hypothetical protein
VPPELDALVMRALDASPSKRYQTAREMARDLQRVVAPAPACDVGDWIESIAGASIADRAQRIANIERSSPAIASDDSTPSGIGLDEGTRAGPLKRSSSWKRWAIAAAAVVATVALFDAGMMLARMTPDPVAHVTPAAPPPPPPPPASTTPPVIEAPVVTTPAPTITEIAVDPKELPTNVGNRPPPVFARATPSASHKPPPATSAMSLDHVIDSRK